MGMKFLASVTVVAAVLAVLATYLCLSRSKQRCSHKGDYQRLHLGQIEIRKTDLILS